MSLNLGAGTGFGWREACIILEIIRTKENIKVKKAAVVISVLLFLAGLTFFLQGVNILPGSYMTGNPQWVTNGVIIMIIAGGLFWFARRK